MRGKALCVAVPVSTNRITPAYAGKRSQILTAALQYGDHPRLCGEKEDEPAVLYMVLGSPPPMRGKAVQLPVVMSTTRITPAYAGKSWQAFKADSKPKDHPRLCGEKTKKILKQRYFFHQPASFSFSLQYT